MKTRFLMTALLFMFGATTTIFSQKEAHSVVLEQTSGKFIVQEMTLEAGDYVFEIKNNGVAHDIGFVIAPKGHTDQPNHIKEAYVTKTVSTGNSSLTNTVHLTPGEYVYFCPLNPTPHYKLLVK